MGNNLIDENANYVFQCEPFTHIYFYPKIFEEKPDKSDKISNFSSIRENNTLNSESKTLLEKENFKKEKIKETQNGQILKKHIKKLYNDDSNNNSIGHCYSNIIYKFNKCINNCNTINI